MSEHSVRGCNKFGCGLILNEGEVQLVLMMGEDEFELAANLDEDQAKELVAGILRMVDEAKTVNSAVATMGTDAARDYLENWSKRWNSPLN